MSQTLVLELETKTNAVFVLTNDAGRRLVEIKPNGDVELFGDVNEAALRFWTAVCQLSGGTLTKHSK